MNDPDSSPVDPNVQDQHGPRAVLADTHPDGSPVDSDKLAARRTLGLTRSLPVPDSAFGDSDELAPRLKSFESTIKELGTTGGAANPERTWMRLGLVLSVIGIVIAVLGLLLRRGDSSIPVATELLAEIVTAGNGLIFVGFGLLLALLGGIVWLRYSLTRYLRHWLIRLIYEDRANTDRIIQALTAQKGDTDTP